MLDELGLMPKERRRDLSIFAGCCSLIHWERDCEYEVVRGCLEEAEEDQRGLEVSMTASMFRNRASGESDPP